MSGTHTLAYTQLFQTVLENAIHSGGTPDSVPPGTSGMDGGLNIQVAGPASGGHLTMPAPVAGVPNEAVLSGPGVPNIGATVNVPSGYQYLFDNINGASTVAGNISGLYAVVAGTNSQATFDLTGGNNTVIFDDGNNTFNGAGSSGGDLVVAGTGFDTIITGPSNASGADSIFSGTGNATIVLNDTTSSSANGDVPNAIVVLEEGHAVVTAGGAYDAVLSLTEGQTIFGGTATGDQLNVYVGGGNDLIVGNGGSVAVEGDSSGNTVFSGSGSLFYSAGAGSGSNTVEGTNGGTVIMFGANGASLSYGDDGSVANGHAWFVAGDGNETLNGGGASNAMVLFGADSTSSGDPNASDYNDSLTAGAGNDTFFTGVGNETLTGGAGNNQFLIDNTGTANNILITDFGASASNVVGFQGYTQDQINAALSGATTVESAYGASTEITLDDGTKVIFAGVTSLTGHVL